MNVWDDIGNPHADRLADRLREMARRAAAGAPRSQQRQLGPSEIGDPCTRCLAEKILGVYEESPFNDPWCAVIGSSVHKWLELAALFENRYHDATWCPETRVLPDNDLLPKGGIADLYDDTDYTVTDHKIVGSPQQKKYKANGPGVRYRRQGHIYGLGFSNAGLRVDHVAIAFWVRGGRLSDLHVWSEPYSADYAHEALDRYRTLRELCAAGGTAILANLPSDPDCYTCSRSNKTAPNAA
jgi:hypothetical protein